MINLIKNELTKIFHKKAIYVVLIITVGFIILNAVLTKIFENEPHYYYDDDIEFYEEQLKTLDRSDPMYKEMYVAIKTNLELAKLIQKYDKDSWQSYVINIKAYDLIQNMLNFEGTEIYDDAKKQYDDFLEKLNSGDWKSFVQEELKEKNANIQELKESKAIQDNTATQQIVDIQIQNLEIEKQVLEWRLEKEIPYGMSIKNSILEQWLSEKQQLMNYNEHEKQKPLTYEEKYEKKNAEEIVALSEYAIQNNTTENIKMNIFNSRYNLSSSTDSELVDSINQYSIFITILIVIIAGTIVSEEFNKGTIKLLLVRPHKRLKILVAKFITCLIILAMAYIVVALLQFIVGGCVYGFDKYTGAVSIYNFNTNRVESIGTFKYLMLSGVSILPKYLLIMTLAFSLSVIFTNSPIAIAIPLLGMMGEGIINELAYNYEKAKFLRFFVTPNWDLSIYLFGKLPQFEPISLPFSICICIIYFVIMAVTSMIVFKKKEIKNI